MQPILRVRLLAGRSGGKTRSGLDPGPRRRRARPRTARPRLKAGAGSESRDGTPSGEPVPGLIRDLAREADPLRPSGPRLEAGADCLSARPATAASTQARSAGCAPARGRGGFGMPRCHTLWKTRPGPDPGPRAGGRSAPPLGAPARGRSGLSIGAPRYRRINTSSIRRLRRLKAGAGSECRDATPSGRPVPGLTREPRAGGRSAPPLGAPARGRGGLCIGAPPTAASAPARSAGCAPGRPRSPARPAAGTGRSRWRPDGRAGCRPRRTGTEPPTAPALG
ncbi:hypothetical protein Wenmar_00732 [Wenxinia marina DSM 24838]|uniref:Uncharacterized protein n=1 Tax=Wenxinia marina DSM 24838 TaxID=1123501 RepID=A0A0D0PG81_9RHOB|nr:hypothetical protein Wenmar_00732 [Wenxinia marina DSM 24838]